MATLRMRWDGVKRDMPESDIGAGPLLVRRPYVRLWEPMVTRYDPRAKSDLEVG